MTTNIIIYSLKDYICYKTSNHLAEPKVYAPTLIYNKAGLKII